MELLNFLRENKFFLYKDDRWYSTLQRFNKTLGTTTYYTDEELMSLYYSIIKTH